MRFAADMSRAFPNAVIRGKSGSNAASSSTSSGSRKLHKSRRWQAVWRSVANSVTGIPKRVFNKTTGIGPTLGRDQSRIGANARTDRPHNLLPNCLGRCSFCAPACRHACQLSETKNDGLTGSARERHGLFRYGAFQAARIRRPSIQYSRVVLPPGPNSWPLSIPAACSVPARTCFLLALSALSRSVARLPHTAR
jgi:hypothetical protein